VVFHYNLVISTSGRYLFYVPDLLRFITSFETCDPKGYDIIVNLLLKQYTRKRVVEDVPLRGGTSLIASVI
jgi:hypothetical protein